MCHRCKKILLLLLLLINNYIISIFSIIYQYNNKYYHDKYYYCVCYYCYPYHYWYCHHITIITFIYQSSMRGEYLAFLGVSICRFHMCMCDEITIVIIPNIIWSESKFAFSSLYKQTPKSILPFCASTITPHSIWTHHHESTTLFTRKCPFEKLGIYQQVQWQCLQFFCMKCNVEIIQTNVGGEISGGTIRTGFGVQH